MKPLPHKTTPVHRSLGGGSLFCGLKTLAFSLQPLAFVSRVSDQLRNGVNLGHAQTEQ